MTGSMRPSPEIPAAGGSLGSIAHPSTPAPRRHNRANWVALRTLRQLPRLVGETPAGEPVVEVRDVRLLLRDHATFFNRLVPCANCGRETSGDTVRTPADLDVRPGPAMCRDCRRATAETSPPPAKAAVAPPPQAQDPTGPAIGALEARIDELQAAVEAHAAMVPPAEPPHEEAPDEETPDEIAALAERIAQLEAGTTDRGGAVEVAALGRRLDKLEAKGRPAGAETDRLEALERRVEQVADLMVEREARLEEQLEETTAVAEASVAKVEGRLGTIEARADEAAGEMGELGDLHAALDVGLGQLRSDLAGVRESQRDLAMLQDDFDRRLESVATVQRAVTAAEEGKGRRGGRKAVELTAQLAAIQVATDELAKEQKQLRAQLSVIELAADRAAETAAKAWAKVSAVSMLQMAVDAVEERLEVQNEELAALAETVESLLRSGPPKAPAAKAPAAKAPAAKKAARITKRAAPRR